MREQRDAAPYVAAKLGLASARGKDRGRYVGLLLFNITVIF